MEYQLPLCGPFSRIETAMSFLDCVPDKHWKRRFSGFNSVWWWTIQVNSVESKAKTTVKLIMTEIERCRCIENTRPSSLLIAYHLYCMFRIYYLLLLKRLTKPDIFALSCYMINYSRCFVCFGLRKIYSPLHVGIFAYVQCTCMNAN